MSSVSRLSIFLTLLLLVSIFFLSREPELLRKIGAATALEVRATGIPYVFAPCIAVNNILQNFIMKLLLINCYTKKMCPVSSLNGLHCMNSEHLKPLL